MKRMLWMAAALMMTIGALADETMVTSPDGKLKVNVTDEQGKVSYAVTYDGKNMLMPSALGLNTNIGDYTSGLTLKNKRDDEMLKKIGDSFKGKVCSVSGDGNVAEYAVEKLIQLGAKPVTMSDSSGFIYDADGITQEKLDYVKEFRAEHKKIDEYVKKFPNAKFTPNARPWSIKVDCAFPCATQNELDGKDAEMLVKNGVKLVAEGANMPSTLEATQKFLDSGVLFAPGKASNAGGVSVSGLEMSQNSERLSWTSEEVDNYLKRIMCDIHNNAYETATKFGLKTKSGKTDYVAGANIAGFIKVTKAMVAQGLV